MNGRFFTSDNIIKHIYLREKEMTPQLQLQLRVRNSQLRELSLLQFTLIGPIQQGLLFPQPTPQPQHYGIMDQ